MIQVLISDTFAQEKISERLEYKNSFTFSILEPLRREVIFGYERNFNSKNIVSIMVGRKFPSSANSYKSKSFGIFTTKNYNKVSTGYSVSLGYKYMISDYARLYLSAEIHYKYIFYNEKYYQYCVGTSSDSYVSLESMWSDQKGIGIIFGKKLRVLSGNNVGLEFDFYISSGIEYKKQEYTIHGKRQGTCNINTELYELNPPENKLTERWVPTMNIGVLIAMPFTIKRNIK